jgi:hypothetical protein
MVSMAASTYVMPPSGFGCVIKRLVNNLNRIQFSRYFNDGSIIKCLGKTGGINRSRCNDELEIWTLSSTSDANAPE